MNRRRFLTLPVSGLISPTFLSLIHTESFARPEKPVDLRAGTWKTVDLRGKRIGYVPSTMHDVLLRETLNKAGLDPAKDVTLPRIDFFDMGQALARGNIDAFLSGKPYPTQAVVQGYGEILAYPYYDDSVGPINAGMIVTRERSPISVIWCRRELTPMPGPPNTCPSDKPG